MSIKPQNFIDHIMRYGMGIEAKSLVSSTENYKNQIEEHCLIHMPNSTSCTSLIQEH